ncbi:MAG: hydroxymyristoyl-ACP dehydratase [Legionella sp.]|nr:hydroxymyristoyl-ACP dehydratase [Legionella sp.]
MRFLFVDKLFSLDPGKSIQGCKQISANTAYLTEATQGQPYFMPTLIGETVGQLAAWNVMAFHQFQKRPVAGVVASTYFKRPAYVGETIDLEAVIENLDETAVEYRGIASIHGEMILQIEGAIGPLLPMTDFIEVAEVKSQFDHLLSSHLPAVESSPSLCIPPCLPPLDFDQIIEFQPEMRLIAEMTVPPTAPYFADHFPNKPVLPMTILLAYKLNLAHRFMKETSLSNSYQAKEFRKIKMSNFVSPGETLRCELKLKQRSMQEYILTFLSTVNKKRVCIAELLIELTTTKNNDDCLYGTNALSENVL